jgi:hypothetical protein
MGESKKTDKEVIVDLIHLVDCHKKHLFKTYDVFRGTLSITLISFIIVLFSIEVIAIIDRLLFGTMNDVDIIIIALSLIAAFMAFFSFVAQIGERNMVDVRFERALKLKNFTETEKPLLKALIKLRSRNPKTDLEQIYTMHPEMFTKEKLLERVYEEKLFG